MKRWKFNILRFINRLGLLKQNLKFFFFNKIFLVFLVIYLLGNFFLYSQYTQSLKQFALNIKIFTLSEVVNYHPINLLADKFDCQIANGLCDNYSLLLISLFIILEGFVIYSIFKYRRTIRKRVILLYTLSLQILLIVPFLAILIVPYRLFPALTQQADKEIENSIQLLLNENERQKQGITNDLTLIERTIEANDSLPLLNVANPKEEAILQTMGITIESKDSLYRLAVIPYQVYFPEKPSLSKEKIEFEALLFPNNTLVPIKINKNLLTSLMPALTRKTVKKEFSKYSKKSEPRIDTINSKEYLELRKIENEKIKKGIKNHIINLNNFIKESDGIIQINQGIINSYPSDKQNAQNEYENYNRKWGSWYQECKNQLGSDPICEEGKGKIEQGIGILKENIQIVESDKNQAEQNAKLQLDYKNGAISDLYIAKENYQNFLKNPITPENESGVFVSPNQIHIRYDDEIEVPFSEYFSTFIHEYLHYFSSQNINDLPTFLEEGLTDYFNEKFLQGFFKADSLENHLGYPNEVKILHKIAETIPEEKLMNVYFTKSESQFKNNFNTYFKTIGYERFINAVQQITFTNPKDTELKEKLTTEIIELLSQKQATTSGQKN